MTPEFCDVIAFPEMGTIMKAAFMGKIKYYERAREISCAAVKVLALHKADTGLIRIPYLGISENH